MIKCLENEMVYIGSSSNLKKRVRTHKFELKRGTHKNPHLQRCWDKYGEDSFNFSILECCDKSLLFESELKWINSYNAFDSEKGFNIEVPGTGHHNKTGEKLNKKRTYTIRRDKLSIYTQDRDNPIFALNKMTKEVLVFKNPKELSIQLDLNYKKVILTTKYWANIMLNQRVGIKSYKGYIIVYKKDYREDFDYLAHKLIPPQNIKGSNLTKEGKIKNAKKVKLDNKKETKIFNSITEASKFLQTSRQLLLKRYKKDKKFKEWEVSFV